MSENNSHEDTVYSPVAESDDQVNPQHYRNKHGRQIIEVIRHLPFSIGNAIKYTFRYENKENPAQDLTKALWYLDDFFSNPVPAVGVDNITEELVRELLDGVNEFESNCFLSLLDVAYASAFGNVRSFTESTVLAGILIEDQLKSFEEKK